MKKTFARLALAGLAGLASVQSAQAVDVKFYFLFDEVDASVQGSFIVDDSVLSTIYNGGSSPANGGLIDFTKVKDISLHYQPGEFASGGGNFTLADYSYIRWTSDIPLDFYADDSTPAGNDIAWQWDNPRSCDTTPAKGTFALGRAAGSQAPTEIAANCMAGTAVDDYWHPTLHSLYLDKSYVAPAPVPEPSTYGLLMLGLAAVGFAARHRRS